MEEKTNRLDKAKRLRSAWEKTKARRLNLSQRPPAGLRNGKPLPDTERYENVKKRLKHLAQVLSLLHKIYINNKDLYGDRFLAFVGNEVVREWPWKDFPFISAAAQREISSIDQKLKLTGLMKFEIRDKRVREALKNLRYEHWTPMSFFRDVFDLDDNLTAEDFYQILLNYYRVVWITRDENNRLDRKNRCDRSTDTYSKLGIEIHDKTFWDELKDGE